MTLSQDYNTLILVNGDQPPSAKMLFIDTASETLLSGITTVTGSYRGSVVVDQINRVAKVESLSDYLELYDASTFTLVTSIPISASTGSYRSVLFNTTNNLFYILDFGQRLEWVDIFSGSLGSLSLSGYSGVSVNSQMVYDTERDRIYILNVTSDGTYGIITVDCSTNEIIYFANQLYTGAGTGSYEGGLYLDTLTSPSRLLLWTSTSNLVKILSIST